MYMKRAFLAFVVGILCMSTVSAESHLTITGKVTDSKGAAIAKGRVLIHWDPSSGKSGLEDVSVLSDDSGTYFGAGSGGVLRRIRLSPGIHANSSEGDRQGRSESRAQRKA
jgi:hypothetical protein